MRFWVLLFIFVYLAICLRSQHLPQQIRPDHPSTTSPIAQPHLVPPDNAEERKRKKRKKKSENLIGKRSTILREEVEILFVCLFVCLFPPTTCWQRLMPTPSLAKSLVKAL